MLGPVTTARAEADQEPIRLEYVADAGCPSEREFERMVFQRTHSARPAANSETARTFRVTLRNNGAWVHGSLTVREGEQNLVRQVNGRSCKELASVLALATALAIDPLAEISPDPGASKAQPSDADPSGPRATGRADAPSTDITSTRGPGNPAAKGSGSGLSVYDPPDPMPTGETATDWAFTFGPTLAWAATPHAALGPSVGVELGTREPGWAVGATFNGLFTAARNVEGAEADFRLLTASFHGCGLTRAWPDGMHGGVCLHAQLGDLYARSTNIPFPESVHNFWTTVGIHLRVAVDLSEDWWLHANVGPSLILTRYRFVFNEPDTRVFQQGTWTGTAQLILGYRL
jgi:hypothetical protein